MKIYIMSASASDPRVGYEWKPKPVPSEVGEMLAVCSESDKFYSAVIYRGASEYSVLLHNMVLHPLQMDYMKRALKCNYLVCGLKEHEARMLVCWAVENHDELEAKLGSNVIIRVADDHFSFDEGKAESALLSVLTESECLGHLPITQGKSFGEISHCSSQWKKAIEYLKTHQLREKTGMRVVFSELGTRDVSGLDVSLELAETDFEKSEESPLPMVGEDNPILPKMSLNQVMIGCGVLVFAVFGILHNLLATPSEQTETPQNASAPAQQQEPPTAGKTVEQIAATEAVPSQESMDARIQTMPQGVTVNPPSATIDKQKEQPEKKVETKVPPVSENVSSDSVPS